MANGNQFDPIAASALAALDTTRRSLTAAQQDMNAPEVPAQSQIFQTGRQGIQTVAQLSPANVLAKQGGLPGMPGNGGNGGQQGFMGLPSPQQLLPNNLGQVGAQVPSPPSPPTNGNGGGGTTTTTSRGGGQSRSNGTTRT